MTYLYLQDDDNARNEKQTAVSWLKENAPESKYNTAYMVVMGIGDSAWQEFAVLFDGWERAEAKKVRNDGDTSW